MAISLRAASSGSSGSVTGTTITPTLPTGWQGGDFFLFIGVVTGQSSLTFSQTAGTGTWTLFTTGDGNATSGSQITTLVAYRRSASTDTAPTFTASVSGKSSWACIGFTPDAGNTLALDAFGTGDPLKSGAAANNFTPNAATAAASGEVSVVLTAGRRSATGAQASITVTPPSSWTTPTNGTGEWLGGASDKADVATVSYQIGVGSGSVAPGSESVTDSGSGTWTANVYQALIRETVNPAVAPSLPGPVRARSPLPPRGGRTTANPGAPLRNPVTLLNNAENGPTGTAVSAGNSGGRSGNPWDTVAVTGGGALAYDDSHTAHGQGAYEVSTVAAGTAFAGWGASLISGGTTATIWFRQYLYFTAWPAATTRVVTVLQSGTVCASVNILTTGQVRVGAAVGVATTSTATIPQGAWCRIEGFVDSVYNQTELRLYNVPDSFTATETDTSATGLNLSAAPNQIRFGQFASAASIGPYWMDDLGASTSGYIGPVPGTVPPLPAPRRPPIPQAFSRGRGTAGGKGAPVNNPVAGPVFRQAVHPAQARIPQTFSKGRTSGNPGAPVANPTSGPAARPLAGPVRVPVAPPFSKGRTGSSAGAPARNPTSGPPVRPLLGPVQAKRPLFLLGHHVANLGAPVANPTSGPAARPLAGPVRARIPQVFSKGRTSGNPGSPAVHAGPPFYPLNRPARAPVPARIRALPPRGGSGAPARNPVTGPAAYPLQRPVRARQPLPPRGRAAGSTGAPIHNPAPAAAPVYPLGRPVRAPLPPLAQRRGAGEIYRTQPQPVIVLLNNFEGPSGTSITTGNSGGPSGNAFDTIVIGAGATLAYASSPVYQGGSSLQCATVAANTTGATWAAALRTVPQGQIWFRAYLFFPANPAGITRFFTAFSGATGGARFTVSTTGKLLVQNGAAGTITTSANSVPLGTWFRVEGYTAGSATLGVTEVKLFYPASAVVPLETNTATAQNTLGEFTNVEFGPAAGTASQGPYYMDAAGVSNAGYLGPISVPAPVYPLPGPVVARQPRLTPRTGWSSGTAAPRPANPVAGPPVKAPPGPSRAPVPQTFSKGRAAGSKGAPLANPVAGPVFRQATQPARARIPQTFSKGRAQGNPGAPVSNPAPGPRTYPLEGPVRGRLPQLHPRAGRTGSNPGAPARNPAAGPVFRQATGPAQARIPQTWSKGRTTGNPGAPVANPHPAVFYPLNKALRAQPPVFLKGRTSGNKGAPVPLPRFGPPFYPLNHPAGNASRAPGPFRKGRTSGNAGAPVYNPLPPPIPGNWSAAPAGPLAATAAIAAVNTATATPAAAGPLAVIPVVAPAIPAALTVAPAGAQAATVTATSRTGQVLTWEPALPLPVQPPEPAQITPSA